MLAYITYYLIDRNTRKIIMKSYDSQKIKSLYDAYHLYKNVYTLAVVSNGIQPNEAS